MRYTSWRRDESNSSKRSGEGERRDIWVRMKNMRYHRKCKVASG
jgi:hypothetical protein